MRTLMTCSAKNEVLSKARASGTLFVSLLLQKDGTRALLSILIKMTTAIWRIYMVLKRLSILLQKLQRKNRHLSFLFSLPASIPILGTLGTGEIMNSGIGPNSVVSGSLKSILRLRRETWLHFRAFHKPILPVALTELSRSFWFEKFPKDQPHSSYLSPCLKRM